MALPTYPPPQPNPSPAYLTYDRGTTAYFFQNRQTVSTQSAVAGYGNTLGVPNGSTVYAIPNSKAVEGATQDAMIAVDAYGASSTQGPSAVVVVYGSLDAVSFYPLVTLATVATQGSLFSLAKLVTPGIKPKYLTAGVSIYGGAGGTTDSVTASMFA